MKMKISFWVDHWIWQKFFRLFPNHGERSQFLRDMINHAIAVGEQESLSNKVIRRIEDETTD